MSTEQNTGPGWTPAEAPLLGEGAPSPTPEDQDAAEIIKAATEGWPGYLSDDDA